MKKIICLYSLLMFVLFSNAQAIEKKFNVFDQAKGSSAVETSDGQYIIVGQDYDTGEGKKGALYFKLDASGELLWHNFIHQEDGSSTVLTSVVETTDGSFIAMGSSIKYNTPDPGNVTSTIVIKFSGDGTVLWEKSFANPGEPLWNTAIGSHMTAYSDGGVVISINISSLACGGAALIRISADGDLIWSKNYHGAGSGRDILVTAADEIYFTGSINQGDGYKAHITKVNPSDGEQIISRIYDFSENATYGRGLESDGENIYLAGNHDGRLFLTKLSNDGEYSAIWSVFAGNEMDIPVDVEIVNDRIVLAGVSYASGQKSILSMVDFDGNLIDDYTFSNVGGAIGGMRISLGSENTLLMVGSFYESGSTNSTIYFGKSDFPIPSHCSLFNEDVSFDVATAIVTMPSFVESASPIELPIAFERVELSQFEVNNYCSITEVVEHENQPDFIQFYPNPASDQIQFESTFVIKEHKIYDVSGKLILRENSTTNDYQKSVDVSGLNSGVYLIEVTTENGVVNQQFIKR